MVARGRAHLPPQAPSERGTPRLRPYLIAGIGCAIGVLVFADIHHLTLSGSYVAMARSPFRLVVPVPFNQRVAVPWTVGVLPINPLLGLTIVNWACLTGAIGLFWWYLRAFFDGRWATVGAIMLGLTGGVAMSLNQTASSDPAGLLILVAILEMTRRGRWVWVAVLFLAGAFVRETTVFALLPVCWQLAATEGLRSRRMLWVVLAAGLGYVVVHDTPLLYGQVLPSLPYADPGYWRQMIDLNVLVRGTIVAAALGPVAASLGVAWPAAWYGRRDAPLFLRRMLLLALPFVLSLAIAADWVRVLSFAAPGVIPVAIVGMRRRQWLLWLLPANAVIAALVALKGTVFGGW